MPVYLIRQGESGHAVKIGSAGNVRRRLNGLQSSNHERMVILRVLEGGVAEEAALHKRFVAHRIVREWYTFTEEMLSDLGLKDINIDTLPSSMAPSGALHRGSAKGVPKGPMSPERRAQISDGVRTGLLRKRLAALNGSSPP